MGDEAAGRGVLGPGRGGFWGCFWLESTARGRFTGFMSLDWDVRLLGVRECDVCVWSCDFFIYCGSGRDSERGRQ